MTEGPLGPEYPEDPDSTANLLRGAKKGDPRAVERLFQKVRPLLVAFAHGRLPAYQRDLVDTDDLVQNTLTRAFHRLQAFEYRRAGAFLAYLRKILLNEILQEVKKKKRRRTDGPPAEHHLDPGETPSRAAQRREMFDRYERALARLTEAQREAVVMRVDFGLSYQEIAEALDKPTAGAAHMFVSRALARVSRHMRADGGERSG